MNLERSWPHLPKKGNISSGIAGSMSKHCTSMKRMQQVLSCMQDLFGGEGEMCEHGPASSGRRVTDLPAMEPCRFLLYSHSAHALATKFFSYGWMKSSTVFSQKMNCHYSWT